jgi:hypothetical protein
MLMGPRSRSLNKYMIRPASDGVHVIPVLDTTLVEIAREFIGGTMRQFALNGAPFTARFDFYSNFGKWCPWPGYCNLAQSMT